MIIHDSRDHFHYPTQYVLLGAWRLLCPLVPMLWNTLIMKGQRDTGGGGDGAISDGTSMEGLGQGIASFDHRRSSPCLSARDPRRRRKACFRLGAAMGPR